MIMFGLSPQDLSCPGLITSGLSRRVEAGILESLPLLIGTNYDVEWAIDRLLLPRTSFEVLPHSG